MKSILLQALELDESDRSSFLDHATENDPALRDEVESLLSEHDAPADIVERGFVGDHEIAAFNAMHSDLDHADSSYPTQTPAAGELEIEPRIGMRVRHYELLEQLGRGGMGQVFLALDTKLGRRVALKFLRLRSAELIERFLAEARVTAQCHHENIVVIYEADEALGLPYLALEYLDGQPLSELMQHGPLPPQRAMALMLPVVRALAFAHQLGIVHRDLKPDNIFITRTGQVKVLDFGIAKLFESDEDSLPERLQSILPSDSNLTQKGALLGTVPYMSPEQWGWGDVDHRSDLWAVGIILWQMLAGHHPVATPTPVALRRVAEAKDEPMPSIQTVVGDIGPELAQAIDGCLLKDKHQRIASAEVLQRTLESAAGVTDSNDISFERSQDIAPATTIESFRTVGASALLRVSPAQVWVLLFAAGWTLLGMSIGLDAGTSYTASINWGPLFIVVIPFLGAGCMRLMQESDNALFDMAKAGLLESTEPQHRLPIGAFKLWRERLASSRWVIAFAGAGGWVVSLAEWWARYQNQPVATEWWTRAPVLGFSAAFVQGIIIALVVMMSIVMTQYGFTLLDISAGRAGVRVKLNSETQDKRGGFGIFQEPLETALVVIGLLYTALWASNVQHIAIFRGAERGAAADLKATLLAGSWLDIGPGHYSTQMTIIACVTTLSLGMLVIYWIHRAYWVSRGTADTSPWLLPYLPLPAMASVFVVAQACFVFFRFGLILVVLLGLILLGRMVRGLTPT